MATDPKLIGTETNAHNNNLSQGEKKTIAFNNRKSSKKSNKFKKKKRKSKSNNYQLNGDITETEKAQIHTSLLKAIYNYNRLSDDELTKIFQNAMDKLNGYWFRINLPLLFSNKNDIGDIILFILRLFSLNLELKNREYNIPFRYLILDLITPSLHSRPTSHKTANLITPLPQITDFHRSHALEIFNVWVLQITANIPIENTQCNTDCDKLLEKYKQKNLSFLTLREIECLFYGFNLKETLSNRIRNRLCDKIYNLLNIENNASLASEWVIYFNLINYIPYQILLNPLLTKQSSMQYALHYLNSIDSNNIELINNVKYFILSTICTLLQQHKTSISPAKAIKLVQQWDLNMIEFEPLIVGQIKNFLSWIICRGHIDDYAQLFGSKYDVLKYFIIKQCCQHSSTEKSAIKWAEHWGLENDNKCKHIIDNIKLKMQVMHQNGNSMQYNEMKHNYNELITGFDDIEFCNVNIEQIIWVMNEESLQRAYDVLLNKNVKCIGLDLELMAIDLPMKNKPKHCQILQIAIDNISFIFDLQVIDEKNKTFFQLFDGLLLKIFTESNAVKIGIGWRMDLKNLRKQYPNSIAFKSVCKPYLDLINIMKYIKSNEIKYITIDEIKEKNIKNRFKKRKDKEGGLVRITRLVLNKRLNKFEQISNWSNRPLRIEQVKYAALDSMVCCWIWKKCVQWQNENILPDVTSFYDELYHYN